VVRLYYITVSDIGGAVLLEGGVGLVFSHAQTSVLGPHYLTLDSDVQSFAKGRACVKVLL
jgi:hypothetical protein